MRGTKTEVAPGKWRLRVYIGRRANGTPIQVTRTVHGGVRTADRELADMVTKAAKGKLAAGTDSVEQLLNRWLEHCEIQDRSPTTLREYRRIAEKTLVPRIGHLSLRKLDARHLDGIYHELREKGNSAATIRRVHALMSASLKFAERKGLVDQNVARLASPPPVRTGRVETPDADAVRAVVAKAETIDPMLATLVTLAALTGARRGELCAIRWQDIDWNAETLLIARSIYQVKGGGWGEKDTKTHATRKVSLDPLCLEALHRHRHRAEALAAELDLEVRDDGFVFSRSPQGVTPLLPDHVTKLVTRTAKSAGVGTHTHALRHFHATMGFASGFDPVTVSERLGHSDPTTTMRIYGHALEQRDRALAKAIGTELSLGSDATIHDASAKPGHNGQGRAKPRNRSR